MYKLLIDSSQVSLLQSEYNVSQIDSVLLTYYCSSTNSIPCPDNWRVSGAGCAIAGRCYCAGCVSVQVSDCGNHCTVLTSVFTQFFLNATYNIRPFMSLYYIHSCILYISIFRSKFRMKNNPHPDQVVAHVGKGFGKSLTSSKI